MSDERERQRQLHERLDALERELDLFWLNVRSAAEIKRKRAELRAELDALRAEILLTVARGGDDTTH